MASWGICMWSIGSAVSLVSEQLLFQIRSIISAQEIPHTLLRTSLLWHSYHSKAFVGQIYTLSLWEFFTESLQPSQTLSLILTAWLHETEIEFYEVLCE